MISLTKKLDFMRMYLVEEKDNILSTRLERVSERMCDIPQKLA